MRSDQTNYPENNSQKIAEEAEKFSQDCGNYRKDQNYGYLERLGIVANFSENRLLKGNSKATAGSTTDSTRDYFISSIEA